MSARETLSALDRAEAAWGSDMPIWVRILAEECDTSSQAKVAKVVGYSAATISYVLKGRYSGDLQAVETAVRGALMNATHMCPVLGEIGIDRCQVERKRPFSATSSMRARLYRACQSCPHAQGGSDAQQ